ncbi:MAG: hypothetical protein AAB394_01935 [Patescibacteria group bacterium]
MSGSGDYFKKRLASGLGDYCEVKVVNQEGDPQVGVNIALNCSELLCIEITGADGFAMFKLGGIYRLEIFVNHKSYGVYLLDKGVSISIVMQ